MITTKKICWLAGVIFLLVAFGIYKVCFIDGADSNIVHAAHPAEVIKDKAIIPIANEPSKEQKEFTVVDTPKSDVLANEMLENLDVDLSPKAAKALLLLKYPPPHDNIQITDTNGPAIATPFYRYRKGDQYHVRSYQIMTGPGVEKGLPDWVDQGELVVEVKDVNPETQAATLKVHQKNPINWVIGTGSIKDRGGQMTLQEFQVTSYPNGRIEMPKTLEFGGNASMKINMEGQAEGTGTLRFPEGRTVSVGETWKFQSDDPKNKDQETKFTFEGYSLVGGVRCMRIKEKSNATRNMQIKIRDLDVPLKMKIEAEGYHYFDMDSGLQWRSDLTMQTYIESDSPQLAGTLAVGEKTIRTVKQIID